jgi:signal transduction histidine kinase
MARRSQRTKTGCCILVVDDQEEILVSVRGLLEREGHEVLTAEGGAQALELFKRHDIHLLLVDYFMPCMTGEDLIREIRKFDPYVQIILQTGYSGEKPPNQMMADLDIQGYHDKADGPDKLLLWVDVGLKAHRLIGKLRVRERLQTELVANVSHEFRTPLHIIGGYTDLLLQGEFGGLPEAARQSLHRMASATNNLAELVSDLLRYGRLESDVADAGQQWVVTEDLASEMERLAGLLLEGRNVTFTVDIDEAPDGFPTDRVKLRTILRNLVTNAVKFTTRGSIALRLWQEGDRLQFAVSDSGSGIAPADQEIIFEPFRQLDGSASRLYRGIGLGLALSRKLARIMGGKLSLESEPEVGSTFLLSLPVPADEPRWAPLEDRAWQISQAGAERSA